VGGVTTGGCGAGGGVVVGGCGVTVVGGAVGVGVGGDVTTGFDGAGVVVGGGMAQSNRINIAAAKKIVPIIMILRFIEKSPFIINALHQRK
jgi:hypothetical protein